MFEIREAEHEEPFDPKAILDKLSDENLDVVSKLSVIKECAGIPSKIKKLDPEISSRILEVMRESVDSYYIPLIEKLISGEDEQSKPEWNVMDFFKTMYILKEKTKNILYIDDTTTRSGRSIGKSAATNFKDTIVEKRGAGFEEIRSWERRSNTGSTISGHFLKEGSGLDGLYSLCREASYGIIPIEKDRTIDLYVPEGTAGRAIGKQGAVIQEISKILGLDKRISVKEVKDKEGDCFVTRIEDPLDTHSLLYVPTEVEMGFVRSKHYDIDNFKVNTVGSNINFSDTDEFPKPKEMLELPNFFTLERLNELISKTQDEIEHNPRDSRFQFTLLIMSQHPEFWQVLSKLLKGQDTKIIKK